MLFPGPRHMVWLIGLLQGEPFESHIPVGWEEVLPKVLLRQLQNCNIVWKYSVHKCSTFHLAAEKIKRTIAKTMLLIHYNENLKLLHQYFYRNNKPHDCVIQKGMVVTNTKRNISQLCSSSLLFGAFSTFHLIVLMLMVCNITVLVQCFALIKLLQLVPHT